MSRSANYFLLSYKQSLEKMRVILIVKILLIMTGAIRNADY